MQKQTTNKLRVRNQGIPELKQENETNTCTALSDQDRGTPKTIMEPEDPQGKRTTEKRRKPMNYWNKEEKAR